MTTDESTSSILKFHDLCRTCLQVVDVKINIFKYVLKNDRMLVSEALRIALPVITVQEDDKLPQQMCSDCLVKLSQTLAFLKKYSQTHETLTSCLNVIEDKETTESGPEELITIISDELLVAEEDAVNKTNEPEVGLEDSVDVFDNDTEEEDDEVFRCHLCKNNVFSNHDDLEKHLQLHDKFAKPFECDRCDKKFTLKHNMLRHQLLHKGVKRFSCTFCEKAFFTRQQLTNHLKVHQRTNAFMCDECGNRYKFEHFLRQHKNTCHQPLVLKTKPEKPKSQLEQAQTVVAGEQKQQTGFLCADCGRRLKTRVALRLHMRIHTGEKPYKCEDCYRTFSQGSSLIYHRRTHTGEKPYCCGVCYRTFAQPAHLKTHMKTHTGEKPYQCPYCGKDFALKKNMIVHSRIHTGERPFSCEMCDKKFVDPSSRKKHVRKHHLYNIGEEVKVPRLKVLKARKDPVFTIEDEVEDESLTGVQVTSVYVVKSEV